MTKTNLCLVSARQPRSLKIVVHLGDRSYLISGRLHGNSSGMFRIDRDCINQGLFEAIKRLYEN